MNRREALAAVSVLLGGTVVGSQAFLSGCSPAGSGKVSGGVLRTADQALLDEIGETIIPTTPDSPGAKAAKIGEFMNTMVTDCYSPVEQKTFRAGLPKLKAAAKEKYEKDFATLSPTERHEFLLTLEDEATTYQATRLSDDPETHYYTMIKQLTVWGYFTSEPGATKALRYVAVPGRWDPCIPYNGEKAWAI